MQNSYIDKNLILIYGPTLLSQIQQANILIAGVGGIGVELIKNLTLAGFTCFTLIDFDVVDTSNLNRNLYLKKEHALQRQSKVEVVAKTILEQFPHLKIKTYNQSVMDFQPGFFRAFQIVFCAVDSRNAREYLGAICSIAERPLIEAGTQGLAGQVKTQIRGKFACNVCRRPKEYQEEAGCSVRAIPREPIHAVAWGKDLFDRIWNKLEDKGVEDLLLKEGRIDEEKVRELGIEVFDKYFCVNLKSSYDEELLEKSLSPIRYEEALGMENLESEEKDKKAILLETQKIWSIKKCAENFLESFGILFMRKKNQPPSNPLEIDKDDKDILRFLCAVSNLRMFNFMKVEEASRNKLKYLSLFELRERVQNLIPTISSTNSIAAGIQAAEAIKYIKGEITALKKLYVGIYGESRVQVLAPEIPRFECEACSYKKVYLNLKVREDVTLGEFKEFMERYYCIKDAQIARENNLLYYFNEDDEDMMEIYNENLKMRMKEGVIVMDGLNDVFDFYCYIEVNEDIEGRILVEEGSRREKIVEQQRVYLQQVYDDEKQKMMKLYKRHVFY